MQDQLVARGGWSSLDRAQRKGSYADGWHSLHFLHFYDAAAAAMLSYKDTANPKLAKPAPFVPDDTADCQVRSSVVSTALGIVR
jgi:hypothetical protein